MTDKIVNDMLQQANSVANLSKAIETFVLEGNAVAELLNKAGISGVRAMNGCIGFYAFMSVVAEQGNAVSKPVPGANKDQYLKFCAAVYDMLSLYQRGINEAASTKKDDQK